MAAKYDIRWSTEYSDMIGCQNKTKAKHTEQSFWPVVHLRFLHENAQADLTVRKKQDFVPIEKIANSECRTSTRTVLLKDRFTHSFLLKLFV